MKKIASEQADNLHDEARNLDGGWTHTLWEGSTTEHDRSKSGGEREGGEREIKSSRISCILTHIVDKKTFFFTIQQSLFKSNKQWHQ